MKGRAALPLLPLGLALGLFLLLGAHQLSLPGLHYDEAKEAGINAMQLLTGRPVTAFRDATLNIGPVRLPLMVQDYIGALNVVLALPFLAVGGINVVALRWLPLLIAALTLVMVWRCATRLGGPVAAAAAALLLAVNPSFVFWSRQGIFVTNITALIFMASLLTALRWWQGRRPADLWLTAFLWGLGIYAKLLFAWAIGAMVILATVAGLASRAVSHAGRGATVDKNVHSDDFSRSARATATKGATMNLPIFRTEQEAPTDQLPLRASYLATSARALICFIIPLVPLILFNLRTGGTLTSIFGNLGRSYYGVDNSAFLTNLSTRLEQVVTLLRGEQFWYLGGPTSNPWAPWLAVGLLGMALVAWVIAGARGDRRPPLFLLPVALLALMVAQSAFTVSDLFITHYALLLPLIPLAGGLAVGAVWGHDVGAIPQRLPTGAIPQRLPTGAIPQRLPISGRTRRFAPTALLILVALAGLSWAGGDLWTTVRYHRSLAASGGFATHSDAIGRLAAYLDDKGYATPVALDWGIDAPVRFLTAGRVAPLEIFGYERLDATDKGFAGRVAPLLQDSNTVYVGHRPDKAVFQGRVEAMAELAAREKRLWLQEAWFSDRSGEVSFIIYRAIPGG